VIFECADQRSRVAVKISVIDRDLPSLLSKPVIRGLRGVVDTDSMILFLRTFGDSVYIPMFDVPSGHLGVDIGSALKRGSAWLF